MYHYLYIVILQDNLCQRFRNVVFILQKKKKKIQDQREHPALTTLTRTLLSKNSFFLMFSGHLLYIEK